MLLDILWKNKMNKIISKRGTDVPFKIIEGKKGGPLVVMLHGLISNMHEDNRYIQIGEALKEFGINSIMFAQIDSEESKEDFINYSLDSAIDDLDVCIKYMIDEYKIDKDNISLIGYSLGSRIASLVLNKYHIKNVVFIAGAIFKGFINNEFLGNDIHELKKEIKEKGYGTFYYEFEDEYLKISKEFINNMEEYDPFIELNKFNGNALIIHGKNDDVVDIKHAYQVYKSLNNTNYKKLIVYKNSDHSFGGWSTNLNIQESNSMCNDVIEFLRNKIII